MCEASGIGQSRHGEDSKVDLSGVCQKTYPDISQDHMDLHLALVRATFIRRTSAKKPMEEAVPGPLALTQEKMTTSASLPCRRQMFVSKW